MTRAEEIALTDEVKAHHEWLEHLTEYVENLVRELLASLPPYDLQHDVRAARIKFRDQMENL